MSVGADPDDASIEARIRSGAPEARTRLESAVDALDRAVEDWQPGPGSEIVNDVIVMRGFDYPPELSQVIGELDAVGAVPVFDWMRWRDAPTSKADLHHAALADVARYFTTLVRGERFADGLQVKALQSGMFVAAARRIVAAIGTG